jgi:SAM-dependent methyltransferase
VVLPDLSERVIQDELMDDPGLGPREHRQALEALAVVSRLSLNSERVWREVRRQWEGRTDPAPSPFGRPEASGAKRGWKERKGLRSGLPAIRVLDVACGGGDTVRALKRRADREGVPLEVHGCDVSPAALAHARERARGEGTEVHFFQLDALRAPLPRGYDIVCSSLFLHHLTEEEAVDVLARMAEAGNSLVLQDLLRSRAGYWLAWWTLRLMSRSRVAHVDGPRSVQASFRIPEVATLARKAGLDDVRIVRCWPQRFTLYWRRI